MKTNIKNITNVPITEANIVNRKISTYLAQRAIKSMLIELSCTPKPGCVDRYSNGAHKDMNFETLLSGISAIAPYFYQIAEVAKKADDLEKLFLDIRKIGLEAENDMYVYTGGINTHKGQIFALGILVAASSFILQYKSYIEMKDLSDIVQKMVTSTLTKEIEDIYKKSPQNLSNGEKVYLKYKVGGAREMALNGYKRVYEHGVVFMRNLLYLKFSMNKVLVNTFLNLLSKIDDTNILHRGSEESLKIAKEMAKQALDLGGILNIKGEKFIENMDLYFKENNISPGGTADMLAVSYFLHHTIDWKEKNYEL